VVLIGPRQESPGPARIAPVWRLVPKLVVVADPDGPSDAYAQEIIGMTNAWTLRADLARLGDGSDRDEVFAQQVTSLTVKFALEQAAFELAARGMAAGKGAGKAVGDEENR
jgi:hypothetical protein